MQIVHILHIIDHVTKYSTVAVVKSEKKDNITETFLKNWFVIFNDPKVVLLSKGREFNNKLLCKFGHSTYEKKKKKSQSVNIHDKEQTEKVGNIEEQYDICLK